MVQTPEDYRASLKRHQDFDDLMLELSGFSGKTPRFLRPEQLARIRREMDLVTDENEPSERWRRYIELMDHISRRLFEIDRALDRALKRSAQQLAEAREALEDIRRRAAVNDKGEKVYRTRDRKRAFTDDGRELSAEEMARVDWHEGAPSWEERQAAGDRVKAALREHQDLQDYKTRADYYRDRMRSGDALNESDLRDMQRDLDAMPAALRREFESPPLRREQGSFLSQGFALAAEDLAEIKAHMPAPAPGAPEFPRP